MGKPFDTKFTNALNRLKTTLVLFKFQKPMPVLKENDFSNFRRLPIEIGEKLAPILTITLVIFTRNFRYALETRETVQLGQSVGKSRSKRQKSSVLGQRS